MLATDVLGRLGGMAVSRIERLMNLTAYLLDSKQPRTAEELREKISGYEQGSLDSFRRMFERDKETLRELEIPLEVVKVEANSGIVDAYFIDEDRYWMRDPGLLPDEQAALMLAFELVDVGVPPADIGDLGLSPMKLGIDALAETISPPVGATVDVDETTLDFFTAITERREVQFHYQTPGGESSERKLQPLSLASVGGHWYVAGTDLDRGADRIYRVDRVTGGVRSGSPGAFEAEVRPDIRAQLAGGPWTFGEGVVRVKVRFASDVVWRAKNLFRSAAEFTNNGDDVLMTLDVAEPANLIESILSFGPDAEVLEPESLRSGLVSHLKALSA